MHKLKQIEIKWENINTNDILKAYKYVLFSCRLVKKQNVIEKETCIFPFQWNCKIYWTNGECKFALFNTVSLSFH